MDRRGFLKGVVGGVSAAGVLVQASDAEIFAFGKNNVEIGAPAILYGSNVPVGNVQYGRVMAKTDLMLYNERGEAVVIVTGIDLHMEQIDVTPDGGQYRQYMPGPRRATISGAVIGRLEQENNLVVLRG